jgi:hypothetical protein
MLQSSNKEPSKDEHGQWSVPPRGNALSHRWWKYETCILTKLTNIYRYVRKFPKCNLIMVFADHKLWGKLEHLLKLVTFNMAASR